MSIDKIRVVFKSKKLEKEFSNNKISKKIKFTRSSFFLAFVLFLFYIIKDAVLFPEKFSIQVMLLYIIPFITLIIIVVLSYIKIFFKIYKFAYTLLFFSAVYCLLGSMITGAELSNTRHITLMLICLSIYVIGNFNFLYSNILTLCIIALYTFFSYFFEHHGITKLLINLLLILIGSLIGAHFCYRKEYLLRLYFLRKYYNEKKYYKKRIKKYRLTYREKEIIQLILEGKKNVYIGEILFISPKTVKKHIQNIYNKTDLHTKEELFNFFSEKATDFSHN